MKRLALALLLAAAPAHAGNAVRARTPVIHLDESCLVTLDRALTPTVALTYTIPHEDACPFPHGRPTHQFFHLCRAPRPGEALPQWLAQGDLLRAVFLGASPPPVTPADILPTNPDWSGCITALAAARPITCDAAAGDVVWDLRDMSPGTYAVAAYTHHPPVNLWTPRWGLFRVVDSAAGDLPPAAALANRETFVYADETLALDVCAAAEPGATLDLAHALAGAPDDWHPIAAAVPVTGERTIVPWDPPAALGGESLLLRVEIRDPHGRSAVAVAPEPIHVLEVPGQAPDPPAIEPAPDICRTPDQEVPAIACPDDPVSEDITSEPGCNSAARFRDRTGIPLWLLLIAALNRRSRPRHRHVSCARSRATATAVPARHS